MAAVPRVPRHRSGQDSGRRCATWRAVARTVFQVAVALAALLPLVFAQAGISAAEASGWAAVVLGVCATVTRVMAMPEVEAFLRVWLPWLAAHGPEVDAKGD